MLAWESNHAFDDTSMKFGTRAKSDVFVNIEKQSRFRKLSLILKSNMVKIFEIPFIHKETYVPILERRFIVLQQMGNC